MNYVQSAARPLPYLIHIGDEASPARCTFDLAAVKVACNYNRPTSLAVMGLDRLDYANTGVTDPRNLHRGPASS